MLLFSINLKGGNQMFERKKKMIKVQLTYVCRTIGFIAKKDIEIPYLQEGLEISQIFDSVVEGNNEGEIFTIIKIRYLLKDDIYVAWVKKESYDPGDRFNFDDAGWHTKMLL